MRIRHKGLQRLYEFDETRGLPAPFVGKIKRILAVLEQAKGPDELGRVYGAHPLRADRAGYWSLRVTGNWRVVCRFSNGEAVDVDLIDYH